MTARNNFLDPLEPTHGEPGKLYVVGTPIGNLEDITLRAIRILKEVNLIACEDTRRTQKLLNAYKIKTPTVSYHEHNEMTRAPELIIQMEEGSSIALVADAGMPVVSDPGFRLVHLAVRHNIPVVPVPGASAFIAALAASGLAADKFRFLGFLPSKKSDRRKTLEGQKDAVKTLVFYEAPHRLLEMLKDAREILGEREVVIAREVTKVHEEFVRGPISKAIETFQQRAPKGEFTVLIGLPATAEDAPQPTSAASLQAEIQAVMKERQIDERAALKMVARARGVSKSDAYRQLQAEKNRTA
jgi:16S rRNA (cytidine1402-2'-O)-methyltransferase